MKIRDGIAVLCMAGLPMAALADDAHHKDEKKAKPPAAKQADKKSQMGKKDEMHKKMERMHEKMGKKEMMEGKGGMGGGK
jgi:Ni/Co efflux regulator RcnB